jgi:tetratricopeptide (TPR) repeat protein
LPIRISIVLTALIALTFATGWASESGNTATDSNARALDQFIRGTVADQMEDRYRAVFHYQSALRFDSTSGFIYVALAQDYILLGNPSEAGGLLDKALSIHPDYTPALELKALMLRGTGKMPEARAILRKLVEQTPTNTQYMRQLLSIDLNLKDWSDAERLYGKIVAREGESDMLSRQVLSVCMAAGQNDRAIGLLKKLVATDSTDAGLWYALGTCYLQKGDSALGNQYATRACMLDPEEPRYWIGRAVIAADQQRFEEVLTIVDSALVHVQPAAGLYSLKGAALSRLGRKTEAVEAFKTAIDHDSTMFIAMGALALIYDETDSVDQAVALYERAIRLSDSAAVYLNNLAYTLASRGLELDRALDLSQRALALEPKNGAYLDTRGWIDYGLGHYDDALDWLKKASKASPDGATILEHIGDVYAKLGSDGKAKKYYERALKLDPKNETLQKKLAH